MLAALLSLATSAETLSAVEAMRRAAEACRAIVDASYDVVGYGGGLGPEHVRLEGWAALRPRADRRDYPITRMRYRVRLPADGSQAEFECAYLESALVCIDHRARRASDYATAAYLDNEPYAVLESLVRDGDLHCERPEQLGLEQPADVGGVACGRVVRTYGDGSRVVWSISTADSIPRAWEYYAASGELLRAIVTSRMLVNDPANAQRFRIEVPDGYARDERVRLPRLEFGDAGDPAEFLYSEPDEPYLAALREQYELEKLVGPYPDDLDKLRALCHWVHGRWQHDSSGAPSRPDPATILREAAAGRRFRCVEYATVLSGCLNAVGIRARVVGMMRPDVELSLGGAGHVVVEALLPDRGEWCFADPQNDVVPTADGEPLDTVEFQRRLAEPGGLRTGAFREDFSGYPAWAARTMFYLRVPIDQRFGEHARVPGQVGLRPVGSVEPTVFERAFPLRDTEFGTSVRVLYGGS